MREDTFNGNDASLIASINALLDLDAAGSLVPHGLGANARTLLASAAARLAPVGGRGEAKARVEDFAAGFDCDVATHVIDGSVAREHAADLRTILSALQEARGALGPFAEACSHLHPSQPDDGVTLDGIEARQWRRAAEVYRALSPGGAE